MYAYRFLVDVNLPKYFQFFNSPEFSHVTDLDRTMTDEEIWQYAVENNLVILTKDTDFYFKCLVAVNSTKVIYMKVGNLKLRELHLFFAKHWDTIIEKLSVAKLILVEQDSITIIVEENHQ
jgi:predicted nuclease of predicted toxin-antitoxin system